MCCWFIMGLNGFCFIRFNAKHTHIVASCQGLCVPAQCGPVPLQAMTTRGMSKPLWMNDCLSRNSHCLFSFDCVVMGISHKSSSPNANRTQSTAHTITKGARDVVRRVSELQVTLMITALSLMAYDSHCPEVNTDWVSGVFSYCIPR